MEPIDESYFKWLCAKVINIRTPNNKDILLLLNLYKTEFVWLISGDDNRAVDGQYLRPEFLDQLNIEAEHYFMNYPCSVLEMLIAFSRRAAFNTDELEIDWFWLMVDNLGLRELNGTDEENQIDFNEIIDVFLWREYDNLGNGGLFPLRNSNNNQKEIEILYQFYEYLFEKENG